MASLPRVRLVCDDPDQAAFLRLLLSVQHGSLELVGPRGWGGHRGADVLLVEADMEHGDLRVPRGRVRVVAVARHPLSMEAVERLVRNGVDDVLPLCDLNADRLLEAILKSAGRRAQRPRWMRLAHRAATRVRASGQLLLTAHA